jgi:hypothetical protein
MNALDQLRTAVAALPPGTLVALPREALLDDLGGAAGEGTTTPGGGNATVATVDLTVTDLAQQFRRSPSTIRQWLESGRQLRFAIDDRIPATATVVAKLRRR